MVDVLRMAIRLKNSEIFNGGNWVTRILEHISNFVINFCAHSHD